MICSKAVTMSMENWQSATADGFDLGEFRRLCATDENGI